MSVAAANSLWVLACPSESLTEPSATAGVTCMANSVSAGVDTPAETLLAMGVTADVALGSVRLSLGHANTESELAAATRILVAAYETVSGR